MIKVLVILIDHNHGREACTTVESLLALPDAVSFQFIGIQNLPGDGFADWLGKTYSEAIAIRNDHIYGFAANVNRAIKMIPEFQYLLLLNPDVRCQKGLLRGLVDFMDQEQDVGIAGPMLLSMDGTRQPTARAFSTPLAVAARACRIDRIWHAPFAGYLRDDIDVKRPSDVDWVTGAVMMARAKAIERIGPMDEGYFLYSEDQDWCCRMWRGGWRVSYVPHAIAVHMHKREGVNKPWSAAAGHQLCSALRMFRKFDWQLTRTAPGGIPGSGN
jgi:N-acetylglucosaminyl-diphospho-decaprenol L-rhamnosyltransferase